ncbi:MAG: FHA domain-containing protein, partial [Acidobacteriota bacterium]
MSHDDDLSSTLSTLVQTLPAEETAGEPSRTSLLLYHRDGAQLVPLREGQTLTVGRARPADVPIRDRSLSRSHARFTLAQGSLLVEDLESTNGTFVKGKRLRAGERRRAAEGDEVRLGAVTAVLHVLGSVDVPGGLESHDRVIERLEQEILRAQLFGRRVAALLVRAAERKRGHLSRWSQRVRQLLRPVDAIALYDATSALIVLAESGREEAQRLADAIVLGRRKGEPALLAGVAVFPDDAATCDELLAAAREAAQRSSERAPVSVAGAGAAREPHGPERPIIL